MSKIYLRLKTKIQSLCMDMMFEEGHLHRCETCDDYYRHDDYKCKYFTNCAGVINIKFVKKS